MTRRIFLLFTSLLLSLSFSHDVLAITAPKDSLPNYTGQRLHLTGIEVLKQESESVKIRYTLINTGRTDLQLGEDQGQHPQLQILFDQSLKQAQMHAYEHRIREALLEQNVQIAAGHVHQDQEIRFSIAEVFAARGPADEGADATALKEHQPSPPEPAGEELCADLSIEDVTLVKANKRMATIRYTLRNNGAGMAHLTGPDKKEFDNVAVRVSMSHADRLTRSSMIIGGGYIKDKSRPQLAPGQTYTTELKLDISKMTKFTPYLVLELDAYDMVEECDETNNRGAVKVRERD